MAGEPYNVYSGANSFTIANPFWPSTSSTASDNTNTYQNIPIYQSPNIVVYPLPTVFIAPPVLDFSKELVANPVKIDEPIPPRIADVLVRHRRKLMF